MYTLSPPPLKGAKNIILRFLQDNTVNGKCTFSIDAISTLTGYCPATVKTSIRELHKAFAIRITREYGELRNSYVVMRRAS